MSKVRASLFVLALGLGICAPAAAGLVNCTYNVTVARPTCSMWCSKFCEFENPDGSNGGWFAFGCTECSAGSGGRPVN